MLPVCHLINPAYGAIRRDQCLRLLARRRARLAGVLSNVSLTARTSVLTAIGLQREQNRVR